MTQKAPTPRELAAELRAEAASLRWASDLVYQSRGELKTRSVPLDARKIVQDTGALAAYRECILPLMCALAVAGLDAEAYARHLQTVAERGDCEDADAMRTRLKLETLAVEVLVRRRHLALQAEDDLASYVARVDEAMRCPEPTPPSATSTLLKATSVLLAFFFLFGFFGLY